MVRTSCSIIVGDLLIRVASLFVCGKLRTRTVFNHSVEFIA